METLRIAAITKDLLTHATPEYRKGAIRLFKESITPIGVRTPDVRAIARAHYPKELSKKEVLLLCDLLLEKETMEHSIIAFSWAKRRVTQLDIHDFARFERWVTQYVTNWALCDDLCTGVFGMYLLQFPSHRHTMTRWAASSNMWQRRAAAVSLIYSARRRDASILPHVWRIADTLLYDSEDLVQKGYGWLLKEASNIWPQEVFTYVMEHKDTMPRTALRYAIEKYPNDMRKEAMRR